MKMTPIDWAVRLAALIALDHAYKVKIATVADAGRISMVLKIRALIMFDRVIDLDPASSFRSAATPATLPGEHSPPG